MTPYLLWQDISSQDRSLEVDTRASSSCLYCSMFFFRYEIYWKLKACDCLKQFSYCRLTIHAVIQQTFTDSSSVPLPVPGARLMVTRALVKLTFWGRRWGSCFLHSSTQINMARLEELSRRPQRRVYRVRRPMELLTQVGFSLGWVMVVVVVWGLKSWFSVLTIQCSGTLNSWEVWKYGLWDVNLTLVQFLERESHILATTNKNLRNGILYHRRRGQGTVHKHVLQGPLIQPWSGNKLSMACWQVVQ